MKIPVELINDPVSADGAPDIEALDWSTTGAEDPHQEINDRRARLEDAETLRLVRSL